MYWWSYQFQVWIECYGTDWEYSREKGHIWAVEFRMELRRCGDGWYGSQGYTFAYNGGWHGGGLWSGYDYLP